MLPITSLAFPPLPLSAARAASPASFGPLPAAQTPWLQLALYSALGAGPRGLVLAAGQRLVRLPGALRGASHALLWPWDAAAVKAQARGGAGACAGTLAAATARWRVCFHALHRQQADAPSCAHRVQPIPPLLVSSSPRPCRRCLWWWTPSSCSSP